MANDKPNILIFFTDMQRADTIRALGNTVIRTPNLDRLVAEGTAFSNCFSPSPVCVPARCCMHYGLYPQKTGLFDNGTMMPDNGASYPEMRMMKAYYYASISFVDFQIGRVLDALEASGQLDCTLILFASDHGELLGDFNCYCGRSETYVERGGCLHWRRYARINEDYLKTPDARLLLQDYPSYALNLPGYM